MPTSYPNQGHSSPEVDNKKISRTLPTMQVFINKAGNMVEETLEIDLLRRSLCFVEEILER